jgi:hypothetical protein
MNQMLYLYVAGVVFLTLFLLKSFDAFRAWRFNWMKAIADRAFAEGYAYGCIRSKVVTVTPDRPFYRCEDCAERLWNEIDEMTEEA